MIRAIFVGVWIKAGRLSRWAESPAVAGVRSWSVHVPIEALARPFEDSVERLSGNGRNREEERSCQFSAVALTKQQTSIPRQDPDVVAVMMERVLPAAHADHAH